VNRLSTALAVLAGISLLAVTFCGVCFLAGAAYLALASQFSAWLAALLIGSVMLLPLLSATAWLLYQRRQQQRHRIAGFTAELARRALDDPYGFVGGAFMSGMMLSTSAASLRHVTEFLAARAGSRSEG